MSIDNRISDLQEAALTAADLFVKSHFETDQEESVTWDLMFNKLVACATQAAIDAIGDYINNEDPVPRVPVEGTYTLAILSLSSGAHHPLDSYATTIADNIATMGWQVVTYGWISSIPPISALNETISDVDTVFEVTDIHRFGDVSTGWYCACVDKYRVDLDPIIDVMEITNIVGNTITVTRTGTQQAHPEDRLVWFAQTAESLHHFDAVLVVAHADSSANNTTAAALLRTLNEYHIPLMIGPGSSGFYYASANTLAAKLGLCDTSYRHSSVGLGGNSYAFRINYVLQTLGHAILNGDYERLGLPQAIKIKDVGLDNKSGIPKDSRIAGTSIAAPMVSRGDDICILATEYGQYTLTGWQTGARILFAGCFDYRHVTADKMGTSGISLLKNCIKWIIGGNWHYDVIPEYYPDRPIAYHNDITCAVNARSYGGRVLELTAPRNAYIFDTPTSGNFLLWIQWRLNRVRRGLHLGPGINVTSFTSATGNEIYTGYFYAISWHGSFSVYAPKWRSPNNMYPEGYHVQTGRELFYTSAHWRAAPWLYNSYIFVLGDKYKIVNDLEGFATVGLVPGLHFSGLSGPHNNFGSTYGVATSGFAAFRLPTFVYEGEHPITVSISCHKVIPQSDWAAWNITYAD